MASPRFAGARRGIRALSLRSFLLLPVLALLAVPTWVEAQQTYRPPLHGQHWMALTGKPLAAGATREEAIRTAYERFYRGDIAEEFVRGVQEEGGIITLDDLAGWDVGFEEPVSTTYKGIQVFKLTSWTQGPVLLQALNLLESEDLRALGFNSKRYVHAVSQAMHMAFADRDFYYGDPRVAPHTPLEGLLSKEYARDRWATLDRERNDPDMGPGDPYPYHWKNGTTWGGASHHGEDYGISW
jgi:gamma-glutamyltranspeptidase